MADRRVGGRRDCRSASRQEVDPGRRPTIRSRPPDAAAATALVARGSGIAEFRQEASRRLNAEPAEPAEKAQLCEFCGFCVDRTLSGRSTSVSVREAVPAVIALHGRLDETRAVIVATAQEHESQVARVKRRMRFGRTGTGSGASVTRTGVTR